MVSLVLWYSHDLSWHTGTRVIECDRLILLWCTSTEMLIVGVLKKLVVVLRMWTSTCHQTLPLFTFDSSLPHCLCAHVLCGWTRIKLLRSLHSTREAAVVKKQKICIMTCDLLIFRLLYILKSLNISSNYNFIGWIYEKRQRWVTVVAENNNRYRWRSTPLLSTLYMRRRHGKYTPCV